MKTVWAAHTSYLWSGFRAAGVGLASGIVASGCGILLFVVILGLVLRGGAGLGYAGYALLAVLFGSSQLLGMAIVLARNGRRVRLWPAAVVFGLCHVVGSFGFAGVVASTDAGAFLWDVYPAVFKWGIFATLAGVVLAVVIRAGLVLVEVVAGRRIGVVFDDVLECMHCGGVMCAGVACACPRCGTSFAEGAWRLTRADQAATGDSEIASDGTAAQCSRGDGASTL